MVLFWRLVGSFGAVSAISSLIIVISYLLLPKLRRHPTSLIFWLSVCDFILSVRYTLTSVIPNSSSLIDHPGWCYFQAAWIQFWALASISWNGMIALNLILKLRKARVAPDHSRFFLQRAWNDGDGTCWIPDEYASWRWLFFAPLVVCWFLSVMSLFFAWGSSEHVGDLSVEARRSVRIRMLLYTAVFTVCWSGAVIHRATQYLCDSQILNANSTLCSVLINDSPDHPGALVYWDAMGSCMQVARCLSPQGFFNAVIWLINPNFYWTIRERLETIYLFKKWMEWTDPLTNPLMQAPTEANLLNLGPALRRHFIFGLLEGMRKSIQENVLPGESSVEDWDDIAELTVETERGGAVFRFLDYAPRAMNAVRETSGIRAETYLAELEPSHFLAKILDGNISEGRSGSFFVFSPDGSFLLKTIPEQEALLLHRLLPQMLEYLHHRPDSTLARVYGLHGVKPKSGDMVYVLVMENVFAVPGYNLEIHEKYDLKGSWVDRKASSARIEDPSLLGKDSDWQGTLPFSPAVREALSKQFIEDAEFLARQNIMDYSVLIGVAHLPTEITTTDLSLAEHPRYRRLFSPDERTLYFVGIIDMMQLYDFNKRLERFYKIRIIRKDPDGVSVLPPGPYCRRFSHMCLRILGLDQAPNLQSSQSS